MRKLVKILIVGALVVSLGGSAVAASAVVAVNNALEELRTRSLNDNLSLRSRINQLESVVAEKLPELADRAMEVIAPADGSPEDEDEVVGMDEVTSPAMHAAADADDAPAEAGYLIREYNGIIGVFDADGLLLRTVNVAVSTLPACDREALDEGITAATFEEMNSIVDMYY